MRTNRWSEALNNARKMDKESGRWINTKNRVEVEGLCT